MTTTADMGNRAGRREYAGLAVLALPTILVALDISVLYLALPHLGADLGANSVEQLWITDIYGFMVAGLLITMGNLGDLIGRKRLLLIGGSAFAVASVLAAWATSAEMLIASRALLGIAGATIMPSTMALLSTMFRDPKQYMMALGVWMGCFMGGTALGPIMGGALLEFFWWGSVFLMALPIMVILLLTAPKLLPESRNPQASKLDLVSVGLSLAAILPIVFGLKEISRRGFEALPVVATVVGVVALVLFLRRQRTVREPLLDLRLFRSRTFSGGVSLMVFAGLVAGNQLFVYLYLQSVQGLSPLATALWLLPSVLTTVVAMQIAPLLVRTIRPAHVIACGLVISVLGYSLLIGLDGDGNLSLVIAALVVANIGIAPLGGLSAPIIMRSAPPERAGAASAMISTAGEFGIAMGVATLGVVGTAVYRDQVEVDPAITGKASEAAGESIAGALAVAPTLPEPQASTLLDSAFDAIAASLNATAAISGALILLAGILAMVTLHKVPSSNEATAAHTQQPEPAEVEPAAAESRESARGLTNKSPQHTVSIAGNEPPRGDTAQGS
jgi:DHA2 family multidrug resistance protein-like MFS transporter